MARYSGLSERTYQRHFAQPYAFIRLNQGLIDKALVSIYFQVGVIDASFVLKAAKLPTA